MTKRSWFIFGIIALALLGFMVWRSKINQAKEFNLSAVQSQNIITPMEQNGQIGDHFMGDAQAKVVIVEYSDYQCSACAQQSSRLKEIVGRFPTQVALVVRNFPIPGHINARAAAAAAEAAGKQDKFWQMHDKLYQNFFIWGSENQKRDQLFKKYAQELELNLEQFKQDMASTEVKQKIDFDFALGRAKQIDATPSIFIDDQKVEAEVWSDNEKFIKLIETKLNK